MRQKLTEAYTFDYSPPPTPGYFNEAVNDIDTKMTKDGVTMTNIYDISNTKDSNSKTNLNTVGSISFKSGSILSPSQALSNKTSTVIGSTIKPPGGFSPFPTGGKSSMTPKILASISLPQGVWFINFSIVLGSYAAVPSPTFAGVGTSVPKYPFIITQNTSEYLYLTTSAGDMNVPLNLQGSFVYNQSSSKNTPIHLYGCTYSGQPFFYSIADPLFTATRLA